MNPIGFNPFSRRIDKGGEKKPEAKAKAEIRPTIVQIFFPDRNRTLSYYNDRFDLRVGDIVFVDGKLEGLRGRVTAVSTHFKVKVEDYKRVIGVADTRVVGEFFQAGAHLITFDPLVLPWKQFCSWVKPSKEDETEYYISYDEDGFPLDDLSGLDAPSAVFERSLAYYQENRVSYLCLNGSQGRAIVEGTKPYEVEFQYKDGQISNLFCDCPCGYTCKHEVAVLLQLRETLKIIEKDYAAQWGSYFAIVSKSMFYTFAVDANPKAVLSLS
ncbi:MAG: SWIM zinc finger family protein [Oscillospiraceae bacterium]|nr:SWIM zinc finger family protein [Oscillospiraceae bacterium]